MNIELKKERVIHTRIPVALEEQIKRVAEGLRVPVSNLVRNMLEDALAMTSSWGRTRQDEALDLSEVFGWQALTLNLTTPCARCGQSLGPGDEAFLGLTNRAREGRVFICAACVPRRSSKNGKSKKKE